MPNPNEYNGWTNRATWLVNVWFNPESRADVRYIEEMLEDHVESLSNGEPLNGFIIDVFNAEVQTINWQELSDNCESDEEREEREAEDGPIDPADK